MIKSCSRVGRGTHSQREIAARFIFSPKIWEIQFPPGLTVRPHSSRPNYRLPQSKNHGLALRRRAGASAARKPCFESTGRGDRRSLERYVLHDLQFTRAAPLQRRASKSSASEPRAGDGPFGARGPRRASQKVSVVAPSSGRIGSCFLPFALPFCLVLSILLACVCPVCLPTLSFASS